MSTAPTASHITLTADQMQALQKSHGAVEIRDPTGNRLGFLTAAETHAGVPTEPDPSFGWTADDIRKAKQALASTQRRYTTEEALAHLGLRVSK